MNKNFEYNEFFTTYNIKDSVEVCIYKILICKMKLDSFNYLDYTIAIHKDFNMLVYITKKYKIKNIKKNKIFKVLKM